MILSVLISLAVFFHPVTAFSQPANYEPGDLVASFSQRVASSRLIMDYSFVMEGGAVRVVGDGNVTVQGSCYFLEGDGVRVWCDGTSVWTMDMGAEEVVIESADSGNGLSANPILIVIRIGDSFTWDAGGKRTQYAGKPCTAFTLKPKGKSDFQEVELYLSQDALVGAVLRMGQFLLRFTINSCEFLPCGEVDMFTPPAFSPNAVVTDLR